MTKAKKKHLLKIQELFGGSLDYCKRNYRVNEDGVITMTGYDVASSRQQAKTICHTFLYGKHK